MQLPWMQSPWDTKSSVLTTSTPVLSDDPKQREPDIILAKEALDWKPKIKLEDGLIKTMRNTGRP